MGIYLERLYADPIMTAVTTAFMIFLASLPVRSLMERLLKNDDDPALRRRRKTLSLVSGVLLWMLFQAAVPTMWGDPVGLFALRDGEEERTVVLSHWVRPRKAGRTDWCAIRTFNRDGVEVGRTLWAGVCRLDGQGRVRFAPTEAGLFTYQHARLAVDLWTGEEPFRVDDVLAAARLPGTELRTHGVEETSLRLDLQDGSTRFLTPAGRIEEAPGPAVGHLQVDASVEPGRTQTKALGVFDVQELACGLVRFRKVSFGEGEVYVGKKDATGDELAWDKPLSALGLEAPLRGSLETPEGCWLLGGQVVLIDGAGEVKRQLDLW